MTRELDQPKLPRTARTLKTLASVVIVLAGIKLASSVLVPVLAAAFIAMLVLVPMTLLRERGVPTTLAVGVVGVLTAGILVGFWAMVASSVGQLSADMPMLRERFVELGHSGRLGLASYGFDVPALDATSAEGLDFGAIATQARDSLGAIAGTLGRTVFMIVLAAFMVGEAAGLPVKIRAYFGESRSNDAQLIDAWVKLRRYLWIKTLTSAATGLFAGIGCWILGIPYVFLWAMLAFVLNYIPAIGSLIAAIPPILLGLLLHGWGVAFATSILYIVINVIIGNIIDPKLMGERLGMSPLVVLLSLIFWGFILGPIGMLLAVPFTMLVKLYLDAIGEFPAFRLVLANNREAAEIARRNNPEQTPSGLFRMREHGMLEDSGSGVVGSADPDPSEPTSDSGPRDPAAAASDLALPHPRDPSNAEAQGAPASGTGS